MWSREKFFHPATVISTIALFVAMGGVGYAAATIGTENIKPSAVTTSKIKSGAVTGGKLGAKSVTISKLNTGAVITSKLAKGAVQAPNLGAASVGSAAIAANAVSAGQIADGQVVEGSGSVKDARTTLTNGQTNVTVLSFTGLGTLQASCAAGVATSRFVTDSGTNVNVSVNAVTNGAPDSVSIFRSNPTNGGTITQPNGGTGGIQAVEWQLSLATGATTARVVTITMSTGASLTSCVVTAHAADSAT